MKKIKEKAGFFLLTLSAIFILLIVVTLLLFIGIQGIRVISLEFLFSFPKEGMTSGGIFPAVFGTVALTLITTLFSIPFGYCSGISGHRYDQGGTGKTRMESAGEWSITHPVTGFKVVCYMYMIVPL